MFVRVRTAFHMDHTGAGHSCFLLVRETSFLPLDRGTAGKISRGFFSAPAKVIFVLAFTYM